jgi:hypothetical protein
MKLGLIDTTEGRSRYRWRVGHERVLLEAEVAA